MTNTPKCLMVEVPEGAYSIVINGKYLWFKLGLGRVGGKIALPPDTSIEWAKLATEVSEEEAAELVEWCDNMDGLFYKDYTAKMFHMVLHSAIASLYSYIRSQSKDPNKTIVVKIKM